MYGRGLQDDIPVLLLRNEQILRAERPVETAHASRAGGHIAQSKFPGKDGSYGRQNLTFYAVTGRIKNRLKQAGGKETV